MAAAEEAGAVAMGTVGAMAEMVGGRDSVWLAVGTVAAAEGMDAAGRVGALAELVKRAEAVWLVAGVVVAGGMGAVGPAGETVGSSAQHRHARSLAAHVCGMAARAPCLHS